MRVLAWQRMQSLLDTTPTATLEGTEGDGERRKEQLYKP